MTERETLKPCPFCGGEALRDRTLRYGYRKGDPDAWAYVVRCVSCAASGGWAKTSGNADRLWNQRATPPAGPVVWVERSNGGLDSEAGCYGMWDGDPTGAFAADELGIVHLPESIRAALGLAPGECKRVRLTVMEGNDGR